MTYLINNIRVALVRIFFLKKTIVLFFTGIASIILIMPCNVLGQEIDNLLSYKDIQGENYFRLNYENDFFTATDEYYTQGVQIELVSPVFRKFPIGRLLIHPKFGIVKYGIGIEHDGYTPSSISSDQVLYGDHPFAGCLFLKTFLIAVDPVKKQRFSSALSTGVIGPAAGAKEMQVDIHRWLHNITPHGWQYQVSNDVILNYQAEYEKQAFQLGKYLMVDADATLRLGTLSDKAGSGLTLMTGLFDSPLGNAQSDAKRLRIYVYEHPEAGLIVYDATLQGGMFNHSSPYIIDAKNINNGVLINRCGFVFSYKGIYLEYFKTFQTREFQTGKPHAWGGVQIAFKT